MIFPSSRLKYEKINSLPDPISLVVGCSVSQTMSKVLKIALGRCAEQHLWYMFFIMTVWYIYSHSNHSTSLMEDKIFVSWTKMRFKQEN